MLRNCSSSSWVCGVYTHRKPSNTFHSEREFPVSVWYAFEKEKKNRADAREEKKTLLKKHQNTNKKHFQKTKKHPEKNYALTGDKKTAHFQQLLGFAGKPRTPATPGIPALRFCFRAARAFPLREFSGRACPALMMMNYSCEPPPC